MSSLARVLGHAPFPPQQEEMRGFSDECRLLGCDGAVVERRTECDERSRYTGLCAHLTLRLISV